ncbi:hypothetical protein MD484_g8247, partial [Candolleomyces efflorescens]
MEATGSAHCNLGKPVEPSLADAFWGGTEKFYRKILSYPGAGPAQSERETVILLKRALKEAQVQVELWKEQAEEARKENLQFQIQSKSSAKVHRAELDSAQEELAQIQDEHAKQARLIQKLREEIEIKDKLLRNCQKALTQVTVDIEQNLTNTERNDQLTKQEDKEMKTISSSQLGSGDKDLSTEGRSLRAKDKGDEVGLSRSTANPSLSVTDVMQKVDLLNAEIFHLAAYFGKSFIYEVVDPAKDRQKYREALIKSSYDCASHSLGEALADLLVQNSLAELKEESNPLLVRMVMKIALTNECGALGSRWTSFYEDVDEKASDHETRTNLESRGAESNVLQQIERDKFISELYDRIRANESQAVASDWRSLTRSHLLFSTTGWKHHLMTTVGSIMRIAGWATRSKEDVVQVEKRVDSLFKPILDLRKAMGDLTSTDVALAKVQPGQIFNQSYMEDAYADRSTSSKAKQSAPEQVINTCGLGLEEVIAKKQKRGGVQRYARILFMPKVVLEQTIKEALEPVKGSKSLSSTRSELSLRAT